MEEQTTIGTSSDSKLLNGGFVQRSPQVVLPGCPDEDTGSKGARPKDPPKTRPKTRPKTMLHSGSVSPSEPVPSPPEWLTRLKKRGAVVE